MLAALLSPIALGLPAGFFVPRLLAADPTPALQLAQARTVCAIPGEPVQWIADYCMAMLGTDDEIAASDCIGEQIARAPKDGCAAKAHFKQRLCRIVVANGSRPGSVEACVADPEFGGNTVSHGGVGG
jgi:hypothetical protein